MKATTKYDIGDLVWSLRDNHAVRLDVTRVIVSIEGDGLCEVSYSLHYKKITMTKKILQILI